MTLGRTHGLNFEDVRPFSRQRRNGHGKKTAGGIAKEKNHGLRGRM